jgi:hypothetical protein
VVLGLGVLQHLLGLAGAPEGMQRALSRGDRLARDRGRRRGGSGEHLGAARHGAGLGLSAELPDATLNLASVVLGLLQVVPKTPLVGRLRRHGDMSLERGLELPLLAVRLVEVLDQFCVPGVGVRHLSGFLP